MLDYWLQCCFFAKMVMVNSVEGVVSKVAFSKKAGRKLIKGGTVSINSKFQIFWLTFGTAQPV